MTPASYSTSNKWHVPSILHDPIRSLRERQASALALVPAVSLSKTTLTAFIRTGAETEGELMTGLIVLAELMTVFSFCI